MTAKKSTGTRCARRARKTRRIIRKWPMISQHFSTIPTSQVKTRNTSTIWCGSAHRLARGTSSSWATRVSPTTSSAATTGCYRQRLRQCENPRGSAPLTTSAWSTTGRRSRSPACLPALRERRAVRGGDRTYSCTL